MSGPLKPSLPGNSAARPSTLRSAPARPTTPRAAQGLTASQHPGQLQQAEASAGIDRQLAAAADKPLEFDNELGQRAAEAVGFGLAVNGFTAGITAAFKRFRGGGSSSSGNVEEVLFLRQQLKAKDLQLQAKDLQIADLAALLKTALDTTQQKGEDNTGLRNSEQQQQQQRQLEQQRKQYKIDMAKLEAEVQAAKAEEQAAKAETAALRAAAAESTGAPHRP